MTSNDETAVSGVCLMRSVDDSSIRRTAYCQTLTDRRREVEEVA